MEQDNNYQPNQLSSSYLNKNNKSMLVKCVIILAIILGLLIPIAFVSNLITERMDRQAATEQEISEKWGAAQRIHTPVLALPVEKFTTNAKGIKSYYTEMVYVAPTNARWNNQLLQEAKKRSLYEVLIYKADVQIDFDFKQINWEKLGIDLNAVKWSDASLVLGLSYSSNISQNPIINIGTEQVELLPNVSSNEFTNGFFIKGWTSAKLNEALSIKLLLNGSENFSVVPLANKNEIVISANYPHPSFVGKALPQTSDIAADGFSANWLLGANLRGTPQAWRSMDIAFSDISLGVYLKDMNNNYTQTERILKYAILFLGLTFGMFFFIEHLFRLQMHPLQYVLVGLALVIFYTLLLSFSEHFSFGWAYLIASSATILLISKYVHGIFKTLKVTIGFSIGLTALYAYVYFIIQMEDKALLFGSVALFMLLALIMYFTRNMNKQNVSVT